MTARKSKVVKMTSWTLTKLGGSVLPKLVESVWSKCVKLTTDNACNSAISIKDFEFNLKDLQKNTKILVAKAYDVEEEIQYLERSGRKKRKREVRQWLEDVTSIKKQVVELETEVKSQGFIMRLTDGGLPAKLNDDVDKLVVQSRYFGDLVLNVCGSRPRDRLVTKKKFFLKFFIKHLRAKGKGSDKQCSSEHDGAADGLDGN
ncbi:hypothetical protein SASPL_148286 [Salvia splendens]|uniref:Uncharacterized protein n=1 Tax=Salvia splendens TaxID=180675 RepID=A0A8X8W915_SALSN|nr:hypothetical protein SASPL_148286 [Salvia splendens]